jgi:hypothetical protein
MSGDERERRDSRALEPELITDPYAKAAAEARNGFRQYDAAVATIQLLPGSVLMPAITGPAASR